MTRQMRSPEAQVTADLARLQSYTIRLPRTNMRARRLPPHRHPACHAGDQRLRPAEGARAHEITGPQFHVLRRESTGFTCPKFEIADEDSGESSKAEGGLTPFKLQLNGRQRDGQPEARHQRAGFKKNLGQCAKKSPRALVNSFPAGNAKGPNLRAPSSTKRT